MPCRAASAHFDAYENSATPPRLSSEETRPCGLPARRLRDARRCGMLGPAAGTRRTGGHSVPTIGTSPFICREDDLYLRAEKEVCWPGERQTDVSTCVVPPTLSSYGVRTFAAAGPRLWNSLPVQLRNPDITYGLFRRQLNGNLFLEA